MEFYTFMHQLLDKEGAGHIKLFGGGGGVILPEEIVRLAESGIARIFSPDDGRKMGLQGMINEVVRSCDFRLPDAEEILVESIEKTDFTTIARLITMAENKPGKVSKLLMQTWLTPSSQTRMWVGKSQELL